MNKIASVCVYSASSTKIDPVYFDTAYELGTLLGQQHIRLINGAGNMGLMSAVSDAALAAGGEVTGVASYGIDPACRSGKHARAQENDGRFE